VSIERQAVSGLKWGALAKLAGQGVSWAVTLVVIRLLSPDDYGLMAISTVVIAVMAGIAELGLGASLVQARTLDRNDLARVAGALAAMNLGCALIVMVAAPFIAEVFGDARLANVVRVASIQFLLNAIDAVPQSLSYREMLYKRLAGIELGVTLLGALATLALAWFGLGVWALIIGGLLGSALRTVLLVARAGWIWPVFNFSGIGRHVRFGSTVTTTRLIWQLTYQSDVLIAGRFLTQEAVGLYVVAVHLATLPLQRAMAIVNQVAFPTFALLQDELPRARARMLDAIRLLGFAGIPALWGIAAVAPEFVDVVLGPNWHSTIFPLIVVSLIAPLRMLVMVLATALAGLGRADLELRNTLASAVILVAAFLVGVHWHLNGLAVAWAVAMPLIIVVNFPRTLSALGIEAAQLFRSMRGPLLAGLAMHGAVLLARLPLAAQEEVVRLPVLIAVGAASYLAAAYVLDRSVWIDVKRVASALKS
jgi:teichuronic acid exporter